MQLTTSLKNTILTSVIRKGDVFGIYDEYDGILNFLQKIWPLREMPSEDDRFQNALEDVRQHMVNNDDWTIEYLFKDRFHLLEADDTVYKKFLEALVSPDVRREINVIQDYAAFINGHLESTPFKLIITDYFENLPVYRLGDRIVHRDLPLYMQENRIPFFINTDISQRTYPCFVLQADRWDDFMNVTQFALKFFENTESHKSIGNTKIMKKGEQKTLPVIPLSFVSLDPEFCSLGQSRSFYYKLKEILPEGYQSVLLALRDSAFFPKIRDDFEDETVFTTSLIRNDEAEKLMRTIRFEIFGIDLSTCFKFNFKYKLPFAEESISLLFDFEYASNIDHRVYALIGKNGSGKTKILSSIARKMAEPDGGSFYPRKPLYAKVFTVSYSFFDQFEIPTADASYNYVYCGLKKADGSWLTFEELTSRFFTSIEKIRKKRLVGELQETLFHFVPFDLLRDLFKPGIDMLGNKILFSESEFGRVRGQLSSGQSILIFIITEILAQIRYNSLILYDEPETHLHPNAITALMNTIFSMVERFESFCIIGTHSPLVIRELQARDIHILERIENLPRVRPLTQKSFGENLTVITEDIFGNREVNKHYLTQLEELVRQGKSYQEIVALLQTDADVPLNLNTKLFIKSIIAQRNEEL